jgi:hypothetical protein
MLTAGELIEQLRAFDTKAPVLFRIPSGWTAVQRILPITVAQYGQFCEFCEPNFAYLGAPTLTAALLLADKPPERYPTP